jgi:hypothetical protein
MCDGRGVTSVELKIRDGRQSESLRQLFINVIIGFLSMSIPVGMRQQHLLNYKVFFRFGLLCLTALSAIFQWRSVLLLEKTGVTGEKLRPVASH